MPPALSLAGLFPPIPTPYDTDEVIDFARLSENLQRWNGEPLQGYVLGGSNGEFVLQTPDERVECVRAVKAALTPGRLLIAGSGMESTQATIDLTRRMAAAGADAAMVVTPSYYRGRMTPAALERHFRSVADAAPIPVILYNVPGNTALDMPAQVVINLATHPNVIGLKESGSDVTKIGLMVRETPGDFQILAGSAGMLLAALSVGAVGGINALANIAAARLAKMVQAFRSGDLAGARDMQLPLIEVNSAITARFGIAGLKAAMDMLGYFGGPVRSPLMPLTDDERATLQGVLTKGGLLAAGS